jgi:hypothetical protein
LWNATSFLTLKNLQRLLRTLLEAAKFHLTSQVDSINKYLVYKQCSNMKLSSAGLIRMPEDLNSKPYGIRSLFHAARDCFEKENKV